MGGTQAAGVSLNSSLMFVRRQGTSSACVYSCVCVSNTHSFVLHCASDMQCVGKSRNRELEKKKSSHKATREYSQLHDKVEVRFAFKDLFQRYNICMFNPVRKRKKCRNMSVIYVACLQSQAASSWVATIHVGFTHTCCSHTVWWHKSPSYLPMLTFLIERQGRNGVCTL